MQDLTGDSRVRKPQIAIQNDHSAHRAYNENVITSENNLDTDDGQDSVFSSTMLDVREQLSGILVESP